MGLQVEVCDALQGGHGRLCVVEPACLVVQQKSGQELEQCWQQV
jgi:hypothetical protein